MLDCCYWSLRLLCLFLYPGITGVQYHTWLVVNAVTFGSWFVVNVRSCYLSMDRDSIQVLLLRMHRESINSQGALAREPVCRDFEYQSSFSVR